MWRYLLTAGLIAAVLPVSTSWGAWEEVITSANVRPRELAVEYLRSRAGTDSALAIHEAAIDSAVTFVTTIPSEFVDAEIALYAVASGADTFGCVTLSTAGDCFAAYGVCPGEIASPINTGHLVNELLKRAHWVRRSDEELLSLSRLVVRMSDPFERGRRIVDSAFIEQYSNSDWSDSTASALRIEVQSWGGRSEYTWITESLKMKITPPGVEGVGERREVSLYFFDGDPNVLWKFSAHFDGSKFPYYRVSRVRQESSGEL